MTARVALETRSDFVEPQVGDQQPAVRRLVLPRDRSRRLEAAAGPAGGVDGQDHIGPLDHQLLDRY
jgi:hypothetical protein